MKTAINATVSMYPVTIDYRRSLDEMVKAGKYDFPNLAINIKNFPIVGEGKVTVELVLVHFDRYTENDDAEKELAAAALEPARLEHATAFGEQYPDVQRNYPILFPGSVWTDDVGYRYVPFLRGCCNGNRKLSLYHWGCGCRRRCRIAAVRK